jgi:hypothetical protein
MPPTRLYHAARRRSKRRNAERLQLACGGFTVNSGASATLPLRCNSSTPHPSWLGPPPPLPSCLALLNCCALGLFYNAPTCSRHC